MLTYGVHIGLLGLSDSSDGAQLDVVNSTTSIIQSLSLTGTVPFTKPEDGGPLWGTMYYATAQVRSAQSILIHKLMISLRMQP